MLILGCTNRSRKKNTLELELDKIPEGQIIGNLKDFNFVNFTIDWQNPNQWESDCAYYRVLPKQDSFKSNYWLDFCYEKYRWWDKTEKQNNH
jgi:hypothetical protein